MLDLKKPDHLAASIDVECAPRITLAGREWPVPVLAIKQNRIVIPAMMKALGTLKRIAKAMEDKEQNSEWYLALDLSSEDMDRLCDIAYGALLRAHPGLSRNEFDNLPISLGELLEAAPIIMQQTNAFVGRAAAAASAEAAPAGEAEAARTASTSTSSSPTTANVQAKPGPTS